MYYLYTSTVTNTELSEGSFDHQSGSFDFCEWFMGIIQASFNANFDAPSFKNDKICSPVIRPQASSWVGQRSVKLN